MADFQAHWHFVKTHNPILNFLYVSLTDSTFSHFKKHLHGTKDFRRSPNLIFNKLDDHTVELPNKALSEYLFKEGNTLKLRNSKLGEVGS